MRQLSDFQENCEKRLGRTLSSCGRKILKRSLEGQNETYIHGFVSDCNLEIWIYDDEAMISGQGVDMRFESPDFDDEEKLIDAFVNAVVSQFNE